MQEKTDANHKNASWVTALAAADAAIDASGSGVAKTKADADLILAGKLTDLQGTRDAWVIKAQATTTAMAAWIATDDNTTYTSLTTTEGCGGDLSGAQDGSNSSNDADAD